MTELIDALLAAAGLKPTIVVAGFFGGLLRAMSRKVYTLREVLVSPFAGLLAAGYLTDPFVHYLRAINFPLPTGKDGDISTNALAFIIGIFGMYIADAIVLKIAEKIKEKPVK